MNIGIDAHFVGNQETGNETYTLNLIRSLAAVDPEPNNYSLYFTNVEAAARPVVADTRFRNRLLKPGNPMLRIPIVLPWEAARRPVDVLHTHYIVPPFLPKKTKTVVTIHDISWEYYPRLYRKSHLLQLKTTVPWSARKADRILVASQSLKNGLVEEYAVKPDKIIVIPLAVDGDFAPRDRSSCRARLLSKHGLHGRFILCVGRISPVKNFERVLRAFAWLKKHRRIEEKLVVIGSKVWGSDPFFAALGELQLRQEVMWTGHLNQEELPDFYSAAEVLVFPSIYESFGLPTLEAMACGTPVITSNRGACPEVAGGAALLVDPENWEAIADAIERVLSDAALREQLRAAGIQRARQFSWQATAAQTLAVYQELAQGIQSSATRNPLTAVGDPTGGRRAAGGGRAEINRQLK